MTRGPRNKDTRRRFLKEGAVVAAGAIAAAVAPNAAEAAHSGAPYNLMDALARATVMAWSDQNGYRAQLLTFGSAQSAPQLSTDDQAKAVARTRKALSEAGVLLDSPVVLTVDQYKNGYKPNNGEIVLVLPDPTGGKPSVSAARQQMRLYPLGM